MTAPAVSRMDTVKAMPRSVSQVQQYQRCPYAYRLARIDRVWQRPAAWLPMGTAVHSAAEAWERTGRMMPRDEVHRHATEEYVAGINRLCAETPRMDYWHSSGPYRGEMDIERRFRLVHEHVDRYLDWYEGKGIGDNVLRLGPDDAYALELEFNIVLDGVAVRGFIDQVLVGRVRDIKTGAKPGDLFQLEVYAIALAEQFGIDVVCGDFLMTKTGKPTKPIDLTDVSRDKVSAAFTEMDQGVKAEEFEPTPDPDTCRMCSVSASCSFSAA